MRIGELFETKVEEKIEPVIKVGETADERKLAKEIGGYVVTPLIERYVDEYLEHFTDSFLTQTTEVGVWISGYFGSGKSHLAKIMAMLAENRKLSGSTACDRFKARVPPGSSRKTSIERSLARMPQCETRVMAFNLNTLADSKSRPLPSLLLSQYYLFRGYGGNLIYARVIESELDKRGKLADHHALVEKKTGKTWADIQQNLSFYRKHLYTTACEVAPDAFSSPVEVERALKEAERGELYNVSFLVDALLEDLKQREKARKKSQRFLLVLDESGQWIENDASRLAQLQALIEESAIKGQGRIWTVVTTHGDMGSIYKEARVLEGDMKKIEGRFRFKFALTLENIELVLEDRLFKKTVAGRQELDGLYASRGGVLRGMGQLANTNQMLPECTAEKFPTYYPFFPYQVHLIPEIVKSLRSKGGRGEQLSGSTRTLLAITQDVLRAGRRQYLTEGVGPLVSFDEIYGNLAGEGEISPDVRTELSRLKDVVPGAKPLTTRVAEILFLIRELPYIPRTKDNLARLLVESVDDDLSAVVARIEPELERLMKAKLVARIGEEFEFLTGERRTFEEEVATIESRFMQQDRERGLADNFIHGDGKAHWRRWLDFDTVSYLGTEFPFRLRIDNTSVPGKQGDIALSLVSPLQAMGPVRLDDLESQSLRSDEQYTIFFLSGRVTGFDRDLSRYLAMKEVVENWKRDPHRSEEARKLAMERESNDLVTLERGVITSLKDGIRSGWVVFRGSSHSLPAQQGQTPSEALRADLAGIWPVLYPKFDKVPVRVANDQRAIQEVLSGSLNLTTDIRQLKLYDRANKVDPNSPLLDAIRIYLSTEQNAGRRVLGKDIAAHFSAPPYGWDPNAVRVGLAALVRASSVKVLIGKKAYTNPADRELVDALRVSRQFDRVELVLETEEVPPDVLTETRTFLIKLAKRRGIEETPSALSEAAEDLAKGILGKADTVNLWSSAAGMPLPKSFTGGEDAWRKVKDITSPSLRVTEVHANQEVLESGMLDIEKHAAFQAENSKPFTELTQFVSHLDAIRHLIVSDCGIGKLLDGYAATRKAASFVDKETWKQLQSLKSQAVLETQGLVEKWRAEAKERIDGVLARLPDDLAQRGLAASLVDALSSPLTALRDRLDTVSLPSQAAALPLQADAVIRRLGEQILQEVRNKQAEAQPQPPKAEPAPKSGEGGQEPAPKPEPAPPSGPQPRPIARIRFGSVSTVTRVSTREEWDALRGKLDARVRALLDQGNDVELD